MTSICLQEVVWRITPGQALRRREWQGEYVLYNDISGDTHLLGADAVDLLLALQQAPAPESALVDDDDAALLEQLQALSLIEPVA